MHEEEEEGEHQDKQTSLYARGTQLKTRFGLIFNPPILKTSLASSMSDLICSLKGI